VFPRAESVAIRQLTLKNFRNYADLRLNVESPAIVLTGENGAGKTNLLEAISLLVPGRGLRAASFEELVRHGSSGGWAVAAEVLSSGTLMRLGTAYGAIPPRQQQADRGRHIVIDGALQKSSAPLGRYMRILWLTPPMDRIFSGPPGDRRRLFDRLTAAFYPDHGTRVSSFDKLMRERNRLLSKVYPDQSWLSSLEHHMAEEAVALAAGRLSALDALTAHMDKGIAPSFPWVNLTLEGQIEKALQATPAVQVEDHYRTMLSDSRGLDRSTGRTLIGPHRTDLKTVHGPKGMDAGACSTGEQKAMLVSVILAHAKAMKNMLGGMLPILLLDEAVAHLDAERRTGLFRQLQDLGAQCWLTGTDRALFHGMDQQTIFYAVKEGALAPIG
jgi:DNA replication and repair protein RecF